MYDKHIICDGSLRNVREGSQVIGYSIDARLPYYRGQPLCIVEDLVVTVDGNKADRDALRFGVRGKSWSLAEMETVADERWEFGEVATITVLHPGGLTPGAHEVTLAEQLRISYLPWSPVTSTTKTLAISG